MWILIFILLNGAILFSSHLIAHRYLGESRLSEHLVTTFFLYAAQVTFSLVVLGTVVKNLDILYITLLNGVISSLVIVFLRESIKSSFGKIYKQSVEFLGFAGKSKDYLLYLLLLLFLFQVTATLLKIYYLPPHVGDVLSYHLHPVVEWFQHGKVTGITDSPVFRGNRNPMGSKFLYLWFIAFFGGTTWIELPQFLFGVILSISAYALMLKTGIKRGTALRFGVLIYFLPSVLLQSRTCQDHLILAACTTTMLLYFTDVVYNKTYDRILFLAVVAAFLLGIKKHSPLVFVILFPALLLSRGFNMEKVKSFIRTNRLRLVGSMVIIVVGAGYFYTRNNLIPGKILRFLQMNYKNLLLKLLLPLALVLALAFIGRRVYRKMQNRGWFKHKRVFITLGVVLAVSVAGFVVLKNRTLLKPFVAGHTTPIMRTNRNFDIQYPAFKSKLIKNLLAFPFRIKDIGLYTSYTPDMLEKSGFGVQFFAFGLLAYLLSLLMWLYKKEYRDSIMGFLLIFSLLLLFAYFLIYFSWANYRSFMFFAVIGLIAWAYIQSRHISKRVYLHYIDLLLVLMILFNIAACFFEGNMSPQRWKTLFTIDNPADRTTVKYATLFDMWGGKGESWQFIDTYIPASEPIGFSGGYDAWTFPYFDNGMKRKIFYIKHLPGFDVKKVRKGSHTFNMLEFNPDFMAGLKQRRIHYLHFSTQGTYHRQRVFVPEGQKDVIKITPDLYYVKW
jgi:hypothetical protein